jgi:O-antigen/teichoic acid export membrane protein
VVLLVSGGFSACVYLLFHVLTAMRKQVILLAGYTVTAVFITVSGPVFVMRYQMLGASALCIISNIILVLIFSLMLMTAIMRKRKNLG